MKCDALGLFVVKGISLTLQRPQQNLLMAKFNAISEKCYSGSELLVLL